MDSVKTIKPTFLTLPREIRDNIYDECLEDVRDQFSRQIPRDVDWGSFCMKNKKSVEIQLVCRQIRGEYLARHQAQGELKVFHYLNFPFTTPAFTQLTRHLDICELGCNGHINYSRNPVFKCPIPGVLVSYRKMLMKLTSEMPCLEAVDVCLLISKKHLEPCCLHWVEAVHMLISGIPKVKEFKVDFCALVPSTLVQKKVDLQKSTILRMAKDRTMKRNQFAEYCLFRETNKGSPVRDPEIQEWIQKSGFQIMQIRPMN